MSRPSRNVDQQLLDTGRRLLPHTGCAGLTVRRLAGEAGVNPGMFHYHFRSKHTFLRTLLQRTYDDMFARLEVSAQGGLTARTNLRAALGVLAGFFRDNRALMLRLLADAVAGEEVAADFLRSNVPRHIGVVAALMKQACEEGSLADLPRGQLLGFTFGALGLPILASAAVEAGMLPGAGDFASLPEDCLSDAALEQRIDLVLKALSAGASAKGCSP